MSVIADFLKHFKPAAREISADEQRRYAVQMIGQLLAFKEAEFARLQKEIEHFTIAAPLLEDDHEEKDLIS